MDRNKEFDLGTGRVEALADGIFAFSMTLLVLAIDIPEKIPKADANQALLQHLINLTPQLLVYTMAFIVLGSFWMGHQKHFQCIKRVDGTLLWNNILGLMFVALLPFTTNLAGDYGDYQMGILPMEINLLLLGMFFYGEWSYIISHPELLKKEIDAWTATRGKEKNATIIVVSMIAIGLSFFIPAWSTTLYISIPFIHMSGRYRSPK
ncbi:MAG: TMEM175 family protein [Methanotrichaceae archaeon]|nr:TMEM175 family protein [Methanotrichaceae archaeon]